MLDIKFIRENPEIVKKAIKDKQFSGTIDIDELLKIDSEIREIELKLNDLRQKRNDLNDKIKNAKDPSERDVLIKENSILKPQVQEFETKLSELTPAFDELMLWVPNVPASDVPFGEGEEGNVEVKKVGEIPTFKFTPKDHLDIAEGLDIIDVKRGSKIGGFRAYFLKGKGMVLEQAILRYALDFMIENGFIPMSVPVMVNDGALIGTGYFPWGKDDHYRTQDDQALIGTAEVSLTAYHSGEVLKESDLPVKLVGQSPCFRREVGSHGKDTKGVFRIHYFNKVEQVVLIPADENLSREWHDKMLGYAESILQGLGLSYHVLLMCTGDMGPGQRKKYDVETWFAGQNKYRETHSDSYFNDFQSRRLNIKYVDSKGEKKYVYTLNNTVAATPRLLAAVIENYQNEKGEIVVPEVLRKYTGFDLISND
ncbi:serine--tRNA ligase [candidate division WWE3 bacterium CG_4_9_14_0_2_um_filter_35_11]|uniref:Serine--tRNA ligase n=1 Tax=candidate division WWE3 bacterium CG_4_9_14_0_2_um_filter_35_11 TaxID=1975077 RepID=A0A2M8ELN1_UNCKA|nr:MAG: serine--tRNA ligase [candidate division WWE3 bacterium CG10_big_fil_rev_8_21_14_0_10_35_32]PJC23649.1 MAG: serine--tRNA ligase [candidate division WWE3 bacterium CG_4_9_14_0_2_um_filter_35_11]